MLDSGEGTVEQYLDDTRNNSHLTEANVTNETQTGTGYPDLQDMFPSQMAAIAHSGETQVSQGEPSPTEGPVDALPNREEGGRQV